MQWIYIAHPYGGKPENKAEVEQIIKDLVKQNPKAVYISPIHMFGYLYDDVSYEQGIDYCLDILGACDELILTGDWETSRGCKMEKEYAGKNEIPIKYLR